MVLYQIILLLKKNIPKNSEIVNVEIVIIKLQLNFLAILRTAHSITINQKLMISYILTYDIYINLFHHHSNITMILFLIFLTVARRYCHQYYCIFLFLLGEPYW